jgi:hypothetical protein
VNPDELAELAYNAYRATIGTILPEWRHVPPEQQLAWANGAHAVWLRIMGTELPAKSRHLVQSWQECKHCGFIWPPGKFHNRCPGCQQLYEG